MRRIERSTIEQHERWSARLRRIKDELTQLKGEVSKHRRIAEMGSFRHSLRALSKLRSDMENLMFRDVAEDRKSTRLNSSH